MTECKGARLELELVFDGERTRPLRALATPPLQLSRARYDDPTAPARLSLTLTHLGGVLAGDRATLTVAVGAGADAAVTAAAATQIYTMSRGQAEQRTCITAATAATLHWMPGPQILFAGARYCQSTRVELAQGAFVMLSDTLVPGRLARGERWDFKSYESTIEVVDCDGALLACEHTLIEPARHSPTAPGVMARFAVLGTLWMLGKELDGQRAAEILSAKGGNVGATVLPGRCGALVRVFGPGIAATHQALQRCYRALAAEGCVPPGPALPSL